jgi:hypothetical protein
MSLLGSNEVMKEDVERKLEEGRKKESRKKEIGTEKVTIKDK